MDERRDQARNEHTQNIRSGLPVMKTKYGLTIDEYDYLDMAIDALRDIKHFGTTEYIAYIPVDNEGYAKLPCNLEIIDAVTTVKMGKKVFHERILSELEVSDQNDSYYLQQEIMAGLGYNAGKFPHPGLVNEDGDGYISYQLTMDRRIKVDVRHKGINIAMAYKGISVDPEGYPLITRKQANAIAAISAKNVLTKRAYRGDRNAASMLELAMADSARLKQAASIPENLTDNELDDVLNIQTSFNRKTHNRPSKYRR